MTNNETLADIVAEMRHCVELASPRQRYAPKISLRAWSNLADRIEAAAEREREAAEARQLNECIVVREEEASEWRKLIGNAAAMREALEEQLRYWDTHVRTRDEEAMRQRIECALASPARNCDRYATWKDAWDAFTAAYFGPTDPGEIEYSFGIWLFAKSKEARDGQA